ncbi:zinc-binding alcohol dehydrogenase domain-containing protein 2-like protein [Zychaea mexicana]|uniref:zinc-binding alcohol dehydrogenase domain-containing protein 2-like protein n=1 Tax=Zychaea mexicana TaxID=64656 RepID=UPI0022FEABCB|nr:zinc-binding alcohol dehydrogenase domain-containing protein 2-like protein [Zychaea mexicana]KAI9488170.1 zinc-binding alcohol dehydrogenase domain-containing protein 2-like protein [Zychaea mexicana]
MSAPPSTFRKIQAVEIGNNYRKVTQVVTVPYNSLTDDLKPNQVIVKNLYLGINASDVNYTNAKYVPGIKPPFDVGFESMGQIIQAGSLVPKEAVGSHVLVSQYGAYAEYMSVPYTSVIPVPGNKIEYMALRSSGLTSSIALEEMGRMTTGETVLVTAAAGGAGQIAVQLAKLAGNHVIGTCSSDDKVVMLKSLGCDRVINYKKEDFKTVLKKEYPKGVDIVFESVGGSFFTTCLNSLAVKGRLIVIGMVSTYSGASGMQGDKVDTLKLLGKSRTVAGFFVPDYLHLYPSHMQKLVKLFQEGKLKVEIDSAGLDGIEHVVDGVEYLHSGNNKGKVVIPLLPVNHSKI